MEFINALTQYGIAGIALYLVVKPVTTSLIKRDEEKDRYLRELINNHFKQDQERHELMMRTIQALPENLMVVMKKLSKNKK